jgi:hypothetical protein
MFANPTREIRLCLPHAGNERAGGFEQQMLLLAGGIRVGEGADKDNQIDKVHSVTTTTTALPISTNLPSGSR